MPPDKALTAGPNSVSRSSVFTEERANRALVFVRPVVADIVARYRELANIRLEIHEAETDPRDERQLQVLQDRLDRCEQALTHLHRELSDVGCVLKDWRTGLLDFPALRDGRRIWLCWKLGETAVTHWHEWHEGFTGRKPLESGAAKVEGA